MLGMLAVGRFISGSSSEAGVDLVGLPMPRMQQQGDER